MHLDLLRHFLAHQPRMSRRTALSLGAVATGALSTLGGTPAAARRPGAGARPVPRRQGEFDDTFFDYADPANLADWAPSRYGEGDQRGALNEVTPEKTAAALELLAGESGVDVHQLGELMSNGFPAYVTTPPRIYQQRLVVNGYTPPADFQTNGGILQGVEPLGQNRINVHEERFAAQQAEGFAEPYSTTYQIGTQLDNLNHVGAGDFFYNGFRGPDIAQSWGTTSLGSEHMGPIVTRGVLLDVLGQKLDAGDAAVGEPAANGKPMLAANYRITIADLEAAMDFGGIDAIEPGDAVMIRTGWNQLLDRSSGDFDAAELERWGAAAGMPGIYLAEAKWFGQFRPCIVGSDTWALEVLGSDANDPEILFPAHQELLMRHGIRIGESIVLDSLADAGVYTYVHVVTPQYAKGATAGNAPPAGLAPRGSGTTATTTPASSAPATSEPTATTGATETTSPTGTTEPTATTGATETTAGGATSAPATTAG